MNSCRSSKLCDPCDTRLNICRGNHHQIRQLINNTHNIGQFFLRHFKGIIIPWHLDLCGGGSLFCCHLCFHFPSALLLRLVFRNLRIKAGNITYLGSCKNLIAPIHLSNQPFQSPWHFFRFCHHRNQHMGQSIVQLHFHHLRIYHNKA